MADNSFVNTWRAVNEDADSTDPGDSTASQEPVSQLLPGSDDQTSSSGASIHRSRILQSAARLGPKKASKTTSPCEEVEMSSMKSSASRQPRSKPKPTAVEKTDLSYDDPDALQHGLPQEGPSPLKDSEPMDVDGSNEMALEAARNKEYSDLIEQAIAQVLSRHLPEGTDHDTVESRAMSLLNPRETIAATTATSRVSGFDFADTTSFLNTLPSPPTFPRAHTTAQEYATSSLRVPVVEGSSKPQAFLRRRDSDNKWNVNESAIPLMSKQLRLPTCFRIAEALRLLNDHKNKNPEASHQFTAMELFAMVVEETAQTETAIDSDIETDDTGAGKLEVDMPSRHIIKLADIFFPTRAPYILGIPDWKEPQPRTEMRVAEPEFDFSSVFEPIASEEIVMEQEDDDDDNNVVATHRLVRAIIQPIHRTADDQTAASDFTGGSESTHAMTTRQGCSVSSPLKGKGKAEDALSSPQHNRQGVLATVRILHVREADWDEVNHVRRIVDPES